MGLLYYYAHGHHSVCVIDACRNSGLNLEQHDTILFCALYIFAGWVHTNVLCCQEQPPEASGAAPGPWGGHQQGTALCNVKMYAVEQHI